MEEITLKAKGVEVTDVAYNMIEGRKERTTIIPYSDRPIMWHRIKINVNKTSNGEIESVDLEFTGQTHSMRITKPYKIKSDEVQSKQGSS